MNFTIHSHFQVTPGESSLNSNPMCKLNMENNTEYYCKHTFTTYPTISNKTIVTTALITSISIGAGTIDTTTMVAI